MALFRRMFTFFFRHVLLVIWLILNSLLFYSTYSQYKYEPRFYYLRRMLGCGLCFSRASASVLNISCCLILIPVCRSINTVIRSINPKLSKQFLNNLIDKSKGIHIGVAFTIILASVMHTFAHLANAYNFSRNFDKNYPSINVASNPDENPLVTLLNTTPGCTGLSMVLLLSLLFFTSIKCVRHRYYQLFSYTHKLSFVFLLLLIIHPMRGILKEQINLDSHVPGCIPFNSTSNQSKMCSSLPVFQLHKSQTWIWIAVPMAIYCGDVIFRILQKRNPVQLIGVQNYPNSVMEFHLKQPGLKIRPGQFVLLQCPLISRLEWHPFTVTSCPTSSNPIFTVLIHANGDWTRQLHLLFLSKSKDLCNNNENSVKLFYIDGPFGSAFEHILSHRIVICIAGGIGITPFASFLNHLILETPSNLQRIHLLWICREWNSFLWFSQLLVNLHNKLWLENKPDLFEFQLYLSKPSSSSLDQKNTFSDLLLQRLHFGRPKLKELFHSWKFWYHKQNVNVFCCGPRGLTSKTKNLCADHKFHYFQESFA